ncbi:MAG: putative zinc-binding protein [Thermoanaerobaculia bacterium]
MSETSHPTVVVPCSGIGKSLGSVSREAAYELCENLRPATTRLVALSKLVLGEAEAGQLVRESPVVTIDGCKKMCAASLVRHNDGAVAREIAVLDVFRRHNHLKPEGIAELNEDGHELARVLAAEIADDLDSLGPNGGLHA